MGAKKYFSVDVSNDIYVVKLHKTLEQAKESCLVDATDAHEFAEDMGDYEYYKAHDLPYAIYGKVLGKAKCKLKKLSEEEKDEYCTDLDYVLERPEIVDYPTDNGWIKCKDKLPDFGCSVIVFCGYVCISQIEHKDDGLYWINPHYREHDPFNDPDDYALKNVTHWQPLPQPPIN